MPKPTPSVSSRSGSASDRALGTIVLVLFFLGVVAIAWYRGIADGALVRYVGAAALGDIGRHFSDSDPRYKNIDSRVLLCEVYRLLEKNGYKVSNIDATIIAQAPKMALHIPAMIANIAQDLQMRAGDVNVKAKTAEHLGPVGRGEGIEAEVVCLITATDGAGN